mgnify:CR=1 FL=1
MLRGKWLLNNIFGLPAPPPPPGVDTNLPETKPGAPPATIRERLAQHRQNPSCNSCHATIDPLGFALENFDVIGGWRSTDEAGRRVDAERHHGQRRDGRRADRSACAAAGAAGTISADDHRETARLRAGTAARVLTIGRRCERSSATPRPEIPLVVADPRDRRQSDF